MPSIRLPHFNDIAVLRSIETHRFQTFLLRFDNYLRSQGFIIPAVAAFTDANLRQLLGIFNAHDNSAPAEMIEALFHVSELANDQGMESLLVVASKTGIELPEGDITPADLALLIWLQDPDLLRRANCERIVLRFQSFYCYMNRTLDAPLFELPPESVLKQIEACVNLNNRGRRRGGGAAVWMYEFGNEVAFLIRSGVSLMRDEVMDNSDRPSRESQALAEHWTVYQTWMAATSELAAWTLARDGVTTCEVIEHSNGALVGINRSHGETFEIQRDDQIICKLKLRTLAAQIVETLKD